ncbi:MAG: hypothetical protein GC149_19695 [Gammaproteobacteria bacterium]|nr:hypothetical protein [Gammaproteobacteria bacterium]
MKRPGLIVALLMLIQSHSAAAGEKAQLSTVLSSGTPPAGVVFEIVGGDADSLHAAIGRTQTYRDQLRAKFPALQFEVITHGMEQFSLMKDKTEQYVALHRQVRSLARDQNTPLMVCGAFADMNGVSKNDFPDFVTVTDQAPAAIEDYRYRGFTVIEMDMR